MPSNIIDYLILFKAIILNMHSYNKTITILICVCLGKEDKNPLDDPVLFCDGCFAMIRDGLEFTFISNLFFTLNNFVPGEGSARLPFCPRRWVGPLSYVVPGEGAVQYALPFVQGEGSARSPC